MSKFRKKPIVIEAEQLTSTHTPKGVKVTGHTTKYFGVETLEGVMACDYGDWIITGIAGEIYPCKDNIFRATYDLVEEQ